MVTTIETLLDNKGFDIWSDEYDATVQKSSKEYPFDGYYDVLNLIYNSVRTKETGKILDIGIGTGLLTKRLYKDGFKITGIDFSQKMLDIAQENMTDAKFVRWDFNYGLPLELEHEKYDYIISSYALHHLNNDRKVEFITMLKENMNESGKIIIGDIAFQSEDDLVKCQNKSGSDWDTDEIYIVADDFTKRLVEKGVNARYMQVSSCAGVLEISK